MAQILCSYLNDIPVCENHLLLLVPLPFHNPLHPLGLLWRFNSRTSRPPQLSQGLQIRKSNFPNASNNSKTLQQLIKRPLILCTISWRLHGGGHDQLDQVFTARKYQTKSPDLLQPWWVIEQDWKEDPDVHSSDQVRRTWWMYAY